MHQNMFLNVLKLKKCDKVADTCPFVFHSILDRFKTNKMCDKSIF